MADQTDQARPLVGVVGDCWENKTVSGYRRGIERAHTHAVAQEGLTAGCSTYSRGVGIGSGMRGRGRGRRAYYLLTYLLAVPVAPAPMQASKQQDNGAMVQPPVEGPAESWARGARRGLTRARRSLK